jgi:type II secretory pathway pseudopilin PulG
LILLNVGSRHRLSAGQSLAILLHAATQKCSNGVFGKEHPMRPFLICLTLPLLFTFALAQDPAIQASQIAAQQAQRANQQATEQAIRDAQLANQNAANAQRAAQWNREFAATPRFSVKPGPYSSPLTVTIESNRNTVIYYTTDGWTPTSSSTKYTGPVFIDTTTTLQAVAFTQYGSRSRVAAALYSLPQASTTPSATIPGVVSNAATAASASERALLAHETPVPLVFASTVNSRTAHVGDKVPLTLAEDLKAGNRLIASKGAASFATITEVEKARGMGVPGELVFKVDSLEADGRTIKLRGSAAKEGQDYEAKASAPMIAPLGLLIHGKDAEIKQGTLFTAFIDTGALPTN